MTNQMPPNSRPPRDERQDELIAVVVALGAIGTIFFLGLNRFGDSIMSSRFNDSLIAAGIDNENDLDALLDAGGDGDGFLFLGDAESVSEGGSPQGDRDSQAKRDGGGSSGIVWVTPPPQSTDNDASGGGSSSELSSVGDDDAATDAEGTDAEGTDAEGIGAEETDAEEADSKEAGTEANVASTEDDSDKVDADGEALAESPDTSAPDADTEGEDGETAEGETAEGETADREAPGEAPEGPELATDVPTDEFSDLEEGYWATPFIEGLRQQNVATGFVGGTFEPDAPVSRSQFAAQIYRAFEQGGAVRELEYIDIPVRHPQYEAIGQVTKTGFMSGYPEGDFRPNDRVSKLEVLIALASGLDLKAPSDPETVLRQYYVDVDQIPDWAFPKIAAATEAGIVVNHPDLRSLDPSKSATRAEASAMLYQALVNEGKSGGVESNYLVRPQ